MKEQQYEILNVLNHNALLCKKMFTEETYVFFGKGIGFKKKKGEFFIYDNNVENMKLVLEAEEAIKYKELLQQVNNDKLITVVQNIVYEANKAFDNKINAKLNLTLLDHLNFAIQRQKNNIIIKYPFLSDLKFIYPKEYDFSKKAFDYINEQMKDFIVFDKDELGFLILHIHAALKNIKVSKVLLNNEMMYKCVKIIEQEINEKIDCTSIYYMRFTKHLEYAIQRYKQGIKLQNILLSSVKTVCKNEYNIANKINELLKTQYHVNLDENEIGYLTLHIYNLRNRKIDLMEGNE